MGKLFVFPVVQVDNPVTWVTFRLQMQWIVTYWPPAVRLSVGEKLILHLSSLCQFEIMESFKLEKISKTIKFII